MKEVKYLYHISGICRRESILKNGLLPFSKKKFDNECVIFYENRLFLFEDIENPPFEISVYLEADIWRVIIPEKTRIFIDNFAPKDRHPGCFYIKKKIPVENIKLIQTVYDHVDKVFY